MLQPSVPTFPAQPLHTLVKVAEEINGWFQSGCEAPKTYSVLDLTTRSPFSSPGEPPQRSSMGSLNHWRACQPLLQHSIPLPKGNHFPCSDSLIYSWLDTTPTSLVNATYTSTWSAAAGTNPRGDRVIDVPYTGCHQLRKLPSERINCLSSMSEVPHTVLDEGSVPCLSQTPPYP